MNAFKPETSSRQSDALNTSSGASTSNGMRGERTATSKSRIEPAAEPSSETIAGLVQKVGAPSIAEIEKLMGDLQEVKNFCNPRASEFSERRLAI